MESHEPQNSMGFQLPLNKLLADVPFEEYARADGINAGGLQEIFERSPAHYLESRKNPVSEKESDALRFGKVFHYAVLEPHLYQDRVVVMPEFMAPTKDGKMSNRSAGAIQQKKEWLAQVRPDQSVVTAEEQEKIFRMCEKILNHELACGLLTNSVRETSMSWIDPKWGVRCKVRPDFISDRGVCVNLKTAEHAGPDHFWNACRNHFYDMAAAHYCAGGTATGLYRGDSQVFLVIEKKAPWEIAVYVPDAGILLAGEERREVAMEKYATCFKTNTWPGYPKSAMTLSYPPWMMERIYKDAETRTQNEVPDFMKEVPNEVDR